MATYTIRSSAQQDAIDALKAPLASPALTGIPIAPTAIEGTNTTQIATTAFVTVADNLKANLDSPALINPIINGIAQSGYTGFKNLLINAQGLINQRGYVSGTATTSANEYTLDRWRVVTSGESLVYATTANIRTFTAPAGGIEQVIEGLNIISGTYVISWVGTATCTVNGTVVAKGETFYLIGGTNATIRLTGGTFSLAQVEKGTVATTFEQRPYGLELSLCQRYYEVGTGQDVFFSGNVTAASSYYARLQYKISKRTTPTLTLTSNGASNFSTTTGTLTDSSSSGFTESRAATSTGNGYFISAYKASAEL